MKENSFVLSAAITSDLTPVAIFEATFGMNAGQPWGTLELGGYGIPPCSMRPRDQSLDIDCAQAVTRTKFTNSTATPAQWPK